MISGRSPCPAGAAADAPLLPPAEAGVRPNRLLAPAAALPASEVRKNLRRDHNSIKTSAKTAAANIPSGAYRCQWEVLEKVVQQMSAQNLRENDALRRRRLLDAVVVRPPFLPALRVVAHRLPRDPPHPAPN